MLSTGHDQPHITHLFMCLFSYCVYNVVLCMGSYRLKGVDAGKVNEAAQYCRSMGHFLENIFNTENPALMDLPDWDQESLVLKKQEQSAVNYILFCGFQLRRSGPTVLDFVAFEIPNYDDGR